jgi:PAS domain S-box-containing protein
MHPAVLPAALAFAASLAMAAYVAPQREKTDLHWLLLALLGSLMLWTLGTLSRFCVTSPAGLHASLRLLFLGVFAAPPLWLLLAASYARLGIAVRRRGLYLVLMVPSALAYLALLTNEGHRLVLREESFAALEAGGAAWAGPVFWTFLAWAYTCVFGGALIYLATAGRMVAGDERRRGLLLALASAIPLVVSPIYLFRLLPVPFDLTPASLVISLLISSAAVFRYRLLQSLPVGRRDVIEHLHDGVVMASASGVILDLNPAAERILGRRAWDLRRRPLAAVLADLAPERQGPALREALEQLPRRREPVALELRTTDERRIALSAARTRDGSGGETGQFAVLRDRTDERRLEHLLQQTQRLQTVGTLAAGIAHEVNNPLAFIRANLSQIHRMGELVEQGGEGSEKLGEELADLRQIAEETLDGIARIARIVGDMRGLASEPAEGDEPFVDVDVNAVVRDAIRLANLHRKQVVDLKMLLSDELPAIHGSPERLVQALLNLLLNAKRAVEGARRPRISVTTERDDDAVAIRVSDNGPGIAYEIQERIFDPFFTTKGPDQGTGLGLSIAFDIIRDHGGVLEVRSRPGGGAAFVARIPLTGSPSSS